MNKILISDYDDTLFIDENGIKENVLKIKEFRKAGNKFIISTARNYESIIEEVEKYDIEVDYLICNIGTVILEKSGKIINAIYLTAEQIENIEKILTDVSNIQIIRFGTNKSEEKGCKNLVEYKIIGEKAVLDELKTKITNLYPDFNIEIIENQRLLVEISSKEKAIQIFCDKMNIDKSQIITIGDEDADLEMIRQYNGFRMKKSSELVTSKIDKIANSVAEAIEIIMKEG